MMDAVVAPFESVVKTIKLNEPLIPIISTVTGELLKNDEATDTGYWARHLRATVIFGTAVQKLIDDKHTLFLELGPGNSAATLTRQQAAGKPIAAISTLEKGDEEQSYQTILKAFGQLWLNGIEPDWVAFYQNEIRQKRNDIPTYAFNKQDYWVEPAPKLMVQQIPAKTAQPIHLQHQNIPVPVMRKQELINKVKETLENASGIEMADVTPDISFIEAGLDSLILTQVALMLKKQFSLPITFRQLNEELGSIDLLTNYLDAALPPKAPQPQVQAQPVQQVQQPVQQAQPLQYAQPIQYVSAAQTAICTCSNEWYRFRPDQPTNAIVSYADQSFAGSAAICTSACICCPCRPANKPACSARYLHRLLLQLLLQKQKL